MFIKFKEKEVIKQLPKDIFKTNNVYLYLLGKKIDEIVQWINDHNKDKRIK